MVRLDGKVGENFLLYMWYHLMECQYLETIRHSLII